MNGVLSAIGTEACSETLRCLSSGIFCVGRSNLLTPLADSILTDKFHSDNNITGNELLEVREKGLAFVLSVEAFR